MLNNYTYQYWIITLLILSLGCGTNKQTPKQGVMSTSKITIILESDLKIDSIAATKLGAGFSEKRHFCI